MTKLNALERWAVKRAGNFVRMLAKVDRDEVELLRQSMEMLDVLAGTMRGVGDEAGSAYVAALARRLEGKVAVWAAEPPKRTRKAKQ
jgi:hypothetical protein